MYNLVVETTKLLDEFVGNGEEPEKLKPTANILFSFLKMGQGNSKQNAIDWRQIS